MAGVPFVFGNATTSIPLSNLDADFNTPVTIGNTTVGLGNTVTTLGNVTLTNVNIVSGTVPTANSIVNGTSNVVIASSGGAVNIATNGTQAITVDTSQNVGIGTSSPGRKLNISSGGTNGTQLQINGTLDSAGLTLFPVSGNNWEIQATTASSIIFYNRTNTAEAMRIDSSGNVGIGTSVPGNYAKTAIVGSVGANTLYIGSSTPQGVYISNSTGTDVVYNASGSNAGSHVWQTGNTERMRIDSSGNLLVGTTNTDPASTSTAGTRISSGYISSSANAFPAAAFNRYTSTGVVVNINYAGSTVGSISYNGTTTLYNATSDQRLKENIVDAGSGLAKLANIQIRAFEWIESKQHTDFGVVAQEINSIAPELVTIGEDNEDGTIKTPWQVDTSVLVPAMIKAIQEQQAMIETLTTRLTALENK